MSEPSQAWDELPTETEIYILPNGEIVVADLPVELAAVLETTLLEPIPEAMHVDLGPGTLAHAE